MVPDTTLDDLIAIKHGFAFSSEYFRDEPTDRILLTPGNFHVDQRLYFGPRTKFYDGPVPQGYSLRNGDLLVVMTDLTKDMAILGNAVVLQAEKEVLHNQRIGLVDIKAPDRIDRDYLCSLLNSDIVQRHVRATASGTTVRHTSPKRILEVRAPVPPLPEQRKIAEILSTWDRAIETAQALLATARTQKRALMQTLLTGKRRFPEFKGQDWREVRLGDLATFIKDGTHGTHQRFDEGVCMISAVNILKDNTIDYASAPKISGDDYHKIHRKYSICKDDILLTVVGTLGRTAIVTGDQVFTAQRSVAIIRMNDAVSAEFVHQYFQTRTFQNDLRRRANVTAQPGVYLGEIGKIMIPVVQPAEMAAINRVLADCDLEIQEHRMEIEKLRTEKKALMQQLLTGKRRVLV